MAKTLNAQFREIADQLAIWKHYPTGKDRDDLAINLMDWCEGRIERGKWLVGQVDLFNEYPGPATLCAIIRNRFRRPGWLE